jgi:hypothetical protein
MLRLDSDHIAFNTTIHYTNEAAGPSVTVLHTFILIGMSCRPLDPESDDEVENNGNDTLGEVPF